MLKSTHFGQEETVTTYTSPGWVNTSYVSPMHENTEKIALRDKVKIIRDYKIVGCRQNEVGTVLFLTGFEVGIQLPKLDGSGVTEVLYYPYRQVRKVSPNEVV